MNRLKAKITEHREVAGVTIASVTCPQCGQVHTVALNGWTAIICTRCKAELEVN